MSGYNLPKAPKGPVMSTLMRCSSRPPPDPFVPSTDRRDPYSLSAAFWSPLRPCWAVNSARPFHPEHPAVNVYHNQLLSFDNDTSLRHTSNNLALPLSSSSRSLNFVAKTFFSAASSVIRLPSVLLLVLNFCISSVIILNCSSSAPFERCASTRSCLSLANNSVEAGLGLVSTRPVLTADVVWFRVLSR